jgi:tetratricopeptide (TPR) repeat protein
MKKNLILGICVVLVFALGSAWAQLGQVSGKILGDDGKPLVNAKVVYSNPSNGRKYNYKTDKKGQYVGLGIPYGPYEVTITNDKGEQVVTMTANIGADPADNELQLDLSKPDSQQQGHISHSGTGGASGPAVGGHTLPSTQGVDQSPSKSKNQGQNQGENQGQGQISAGGQATQSGQQQQQQQQPKLSKEQVEEIKKNNAKAESQNALIAQVNTAMQAKDWQGAVTPLQQLISTDPNNWQYYSGLGDAQLNLQQYDQAVEAYEKGIQVAESDADPKNPINKDPAKKKAAIAKMLTNEGNAYLKLKKNKEAVEAYTKAADMDPNPGTAYFNICATQYNTGNVEGALQACDKAIAADPAKAEAYFIKGSLLIGESKMENGKMVPPPGTAEALNKYLELQPQGQHAADVKQMLQAVGADVQTSYKKAKGK